MELSPEEKKKIYQEEKARVEAKAKAEAEVEKAKKKKKASKTALGCLTFILIGVVVAIIFSLMPEKESKIQVRQEDILVNINRDYIITQSYATNKGATDWKGSVSLTLKDEKGGPIYSSIDASWPTVTLKAGERDYRAHKIPKEKIAWAIPHIKAIKVVWKWGNITAEKLVPIK